MTGYFPFCPISFIIPGHVGRGKLCTLVIFVDYFLIKACLKVLNLKVKVCVGPKISPLVTFTSLSSVNSQYLPQQCTFLWFHPTDSLQSFWKCTSHLSLTDKFERKMAAVPRKRLQMICVQTCSLFGDINKFSLKSSQIFSYWCPCCVVGLWEQICYFHITILGDN